jgi:2-polyprenyl-3-methyl-5-hydroxy-6-metoxy-1,4-benzoquinol methylase
MTRFDRRSGNMEIMDDLECAGEVVHQTLRELETINRLLGGNEVTLAGIQDLLGKKSVTDEIIIADWGCGGGDMLMHIADWAKRNNIKTRLVGVDANPNIIAFAITNCQAYPEIDFETANVFSDQFHYRKFDIVLATLFTHHFTDDELVTLLRSVNGQARMGMVINDLHRHWLAYYSIRLLTRLFSKSAMVKFDAPLSVLRAFKRGDWETLLAKAGIKNFTLRWKWAFRWQVVIYQNLLNKEN